jgi:hypothetical protein
MLQKASEVVRENSMKAVGKERKYCNSASLRDTLIALQQ